MTTRTTLVTGGSGFLGGHVIPLLLAEGYVVTALARSREAAARVAQVGARPILGDLDDPAATDAAFAVSGAKTVVNLASLGFGHAPAIVAAAENAGVERAVFVSTTAIHTRLNAQSLAVRQAAEDVIRSSELQWTIVRPTMIFGAPADRNIARLLQMLQRWPVVPVPGGGGRLQQPIHVDDVARAVVTALSRPIAIHRIYDIAGPEPITFRELLEQASEAVGRRPILVSIPLKPAVIGLRAYERISPRPRLRAEQLERLAEDKSFDITPAHGDLDFSPRSFAEGVRQQLALAGSPADARRVDAGAS